MEKQTIIGSHNHGEEKNVLSSSGNFADKLTCKMPNLLLIAGNGRNVGKTTLACKIINRFANETEVTGLKISPHFHKFNKADVIFESENVVITEEKQINSKDSSRMLQSGARKVFFVMANPGHLSEAARFLERLLPNNLVVCESGGLHEHIEPGLFLMVKRKDEEIVKTRLLRFSPILINNDGEYFDFDIQSLHFGNHQIKLKN